MHARRGRWYLYSAWDFSPVPFRRWKFQFEGGPTVDTLVDHINCELANFINGNTSQASDKLKSLLLRLTSDHFVASVTLTLDVLDTQGVNPSASFITPLYPGASYSSMTNFTLAVGGSLSGTQERNISLSYSIDLAELKDSSPGKNEALYCFDPNATGQNLSWPPGRPRFG